MLPIFIFTGMGSEPQNAFLLPCAAAAFPVKKEFRKIRRFSGILIEKIMFSLMMAQRTKS